MSVGDPTAVVGRRIAAYLIEGVIIGIISFLVLRGSFSHLHVYDAPSYCRDQQSAGNNHVCFSAGSTDVYQANGGFYATAFLLGGVVFVLNRVILEGLAGGSLGKLIMGLRVVKEDGTRAGMGKAFIRNILMIVDGACCAIVGLITMFTTQGHRRVGDMAASTYVVAASNEGTPVFRSMGYGAQVPGPGPMPYGAPSPYGAPAPYPGQPAPPAPPHAVQPVPLGATGPRIGQAQWDAARNTYIQWDEGTQAWVQWNSTAQRWEPIST